jgi:hypothetical protein
MRQALVALIVLAVLVVVVDAGLERVAEQHASQHASTFLDAPATVDLRGWPVSLRLLFATLPVVDIHAEGVPTDTGVRVDRLDATLYDVHLHMAALSAGQLPAQARSATFVADFDSATIKQLLGSLRGVTDVRLVDGAIRLEGGGTTTDARVTVKGKTLILTFDRPLRGVPRRLVVPLPTLPQGITVEQVTVLDGALRLQGTFVPNALLTSR